MKEEIARDGTDFEAQLRATCPDRLGRVLASIDQALFGPLYLAGGPVRDWLLGRFPRDLDLTVPVQAIACARQVAAQLGASFVLLDAEEDVARVVWQGMQLDFSGFRKKSRSIEEDLCLRDFTINAMALRLASGKDGLIHLHSPELIDPTGGRADLAARLIRCPNPANLLDDPLRLLRAHRFEASLGFGIDSVTAEGITRHAEHLAEAAGERISWELDLIITSERAAQVVGEMAKNGLLWVIFPELAAGRGMIQPDSHHLDVFGHSLDALGRMEELLKQPDRWFPGQGELFASYLAKSRRPALLKWAALLHDLGKPPSLGRKDGRITFYKHDQRGAALAEEVCRRLHWRRDDRIAVSRLIALHMWPFHLNNARLKAELSSLSAHTKLMPSGYKAELSSLSAHTKLMPSGYKAELSSLSAHTKPMPSGHTTGISRRACLRLVKAAGEDLPGLFLLAMADSLAGQGPGKPTGMEEGLAQLFAMVHQAYREHIEPVFSRPPLLSGHDLIREFGLKPGPVFSEIFGLIEKAQVDGLVRDRTQAINLVRDFLQGRQV